MSMKEICLKNSCTGCKACEVVCPRKCISMEEDSLAALYPKIDGTQCVECGLCERTCPNNHSLVFHTPMECYAAWSKDADTRHSSASGGIAAELYNLSLQSNTFTAGVCWDAERGAFFMPIEKRDDIKRVRNSKYVYSDTNGIYEEIKHRLEKGNPVLFIGLPCQVAGLYGYLKKDYELLSTVDIICHGVAPSAYLDQHIKRIERKKGHITETISFRTPDYYTYTYTFTLTGKGNKEFYKKTVNSSDNYQLGYHHALIYRENCYQCHYAKSERIADLTIGDFSGLGRFAPCEYDRHNVSCVLVNTLKGKAIVEQLAKYVVFDKRPMDEALKVEKQLQYPSVPHQKRKLFVDNFIKTRDFAKASRKALVGDRAQVRKLKIINNAKSLLRTVIPSRLIKIIRNRGNGKS